MQASRDQIGLFVREGHAPGTCVPARASENTQTSEFSFVTFVLFMGDQTYWTFTLTVRIPGLGKVRLAISFENAELTGTYAVLVTNRVDWTAQRIIATYLQRWPIETFYQDGKEHLGLDEYRMRDAAAIQKHWCLVFVAYSLLHLDCLPASLSQSRLPIKTIEEACRQQAQALIEALILHASQQLQQGQKAQDVFAHLFAKQQVSAMA
jgi:hypothetical protein